MFYSIRHLTRFRYSAPVSESQMELRMHPRTEGGQRCLSFLLSVEPRTRLYSYRDYLGNNVHHFDVPGKHVELKIVAEALVEIDSQQDLPDSLPPSAWDDLDAQVAAGDYWEMLMPSQFARPTETLSPLIESLAVHRRDDPLHFLRELNSAIYEWFEYVPKATRVDSPIDHAIEARQGVCQDFAHIMIAGAARQDSVPLCERVRLSALGTSGPVSRRRHACLGGSAAAGPGMGGIRSDQQPDRRGAPHPNRHRTRLRRCAADQGRLQRRSLQPIDGVGAGGAVECSTSAGARGVFSSGRMASSGG